MDIHRHQTIVGSEARAASPSHAHRSSAMLVAAALPWLISDAGSAWRQQVQLSLGLSGACSLAFLIAGLLGAQIAGSGRRFATVAVVGCVGLAAPILIGSPMLTLATLICATSVVAFLHRDALLPMPLSQALLVGGYRGISVRSAAATAAMLWLFVVAAPPTSNHVYLASMGWAFVVVLVAAWRWASTQRKSHPRRSLALLVLMAAELVAAMWAREHPSVVVNLAMATSGLMAWVATSSALVGDKDSTIADIWLGHPARFLVGTFALLCGVGTLVLSMPQCAASGHSIELIDAFFTTVSAVCVTGLTVLDTPVDFSLFGQCAILTFIQVGGLGIMTFSTFGAWLFGRRLSMRHEQAAASLLSAYDRQHLFSAARTVLLFTFTIEAAGALLLTVAFVNQGDGWGSGLYRGVFTAISAFCNAGFALQSTNLVPYQQSPWVLHVVACLIVLGGLSPTAALALPDLVRGRRKFHSVELRLALITTGVLLMVGFVLVLALEWRGSLAHLPIAARFHNAWFQSVTTRTAGFNSIDLTAMGSATLTVFMVLMFIGGSPGGTAGGIKTTTVAVMCLALAHRVRGRTGITVAGRRITQQSLEQAVLVVTVAALSFFTALMAIQITQALNYEEAMFEVISALGTVGLTIGATAKLDGIGKIIIALCMFVGRVGGLSVLLLLVSRDERIVAIDWPEEDVTVG